MIEKYENVFKYACLTSFMMFMFLGLFTTAYSRFNYNNQTKTSSTSNIIRSSYSKRSEGATSDACRFVVESAVRNGGYEYISCHNDYNEAKNSMNNAEFTYDKTPVIYDRNKNKITNMRGGIISTVNIPSASTASLYNDTSNEYTYFNGQYSGEMAFIDSNISNDGRIKGMLVGFSGWVNEFVNGTYELYLVPLAKINDHPKYFVRNEDGYKSLFHTYTYSGSMTTSSSIGRASDSFNYDTNYYSFDGNNFYTDLVSMYNDYRNGNTNNAVIKDYYNYYQYLPFRSKTSYNTDNFKSFLENLGKTNNQIYRNIGGFIGTQNTSGVNSALELAFAIHESGWGTSAIANDKNNLFGLGASDNNPYGNAYFFPNVAFGIEYHSRRTLSNGYLDAGYNYVSPEHKGDWKYFGGYLGNKKGGINVKYASDAYWGEKIAGHYYRMDKYLGFKDYNKYKVLIKNNDQLYNLKYTNDVDGKCAYQTNNDNFTLLTDTFLVTGETGNYYNVMSVVPVASTTGIVPQVYTMSKRGISGVPDEFGYAGRNPVTEAGKVHFAVDYNWENSTLLLSKNYSLVTIGNSDYVHPKDVGTTPVATPTVSNNSVVNPVTPSNPVVSPVINIVINYGDVNGDGNISAADYVLIKNHILGKNSLSGNNLTAADYNKDGNVSAADYVLVKNHILGR